jgi:hypothetical protein
VELASIFASSMIMCLRMATFRYLFSELKSNVGLPRTDSSLPQACNARLFWRGVPRGSAFVPVTACSALV